ncbi:MAG: PQQ-binding-like beta-propeller repeat protein [Bryobacteraceae bacterium]
MARFLVLALLGSAAAMAEDWPGFRGPGGQGVSAEPALPLEWSDTKNVVWKTAVPGRGWSSPSVAGDRIWLTTAAAVAGSGANARSLRLMAFNRESGAVAADIEVFRLDDAGKQHEKNSFASPTPLVEDGKVYVHFGRLGTAAVSTSGEVLWRRQFEYKYAHGTGPSPVLYRNLLIVACDGLDVQYVVALNKTTGETVWKTDRPKPAGMAFATPLVIETENGAQVVSPGARQAVSYDAATGEPLWTVRYGTGFSNVPRPVYAHGLVYICTGFYQPELLAVKPDGRGDVTDTHVVWRYGRGVPLTPSPLVVGEEIYIVSDNGILTCLNAATGAVRYQQRLGGAYSASPVFGAGRIYFQSEEGETTVIAPGTEFRKLGGSAVDEATLASLAPSRGAFFLRTAGHLYRLGASESQEKSIQSVPLGP